MGKVRGLSELLCPYLETVNIGCNHVHDSPLIVLIPVAAQTV